MRIAVLILAILGFVVSLGVGACATVCASCEASTGTTCASIGTPSVYDSFSTNEKGAQNKKDRFEAYRKLFWGNVILGVGVVLQGFLILTGGIVVFSKLGNGESGKTGAIIMAIGLGLSIVTAFVAFFIVSQAGEVFTFKTEDILFSFFAKASVGNVLPLIATVLAFVAKPEPMTVKEVVYVTTQPPTGS